MYPLVLVVPPFAAMLLAWLLGFEIDPLLVALLACIGLIAFAVGIQSKQRVPQDYVVALAFIIGTICFWLARFGVISSIASWLE